MRLSSALKSRAAALTAASAGLFLAALIVALPVGYLFFFQAQRMEETANEIALYRARLTHLPILREETQRLRQEAASIRGLVMAEDAALAAASLQREIEGLVSAHGGELRSTEILKTDIAGGFERIGVENALSLPVNAFADLLYALETHEPYLFLTDMEIVAPRDWERSIENGEEPRLNLEWTIHGFKRETAQ